MIGPPHREGREREKIQLGRYCQHFIAHLDGLFHTCGPADFTLLAVRHIAAFLASHLYKEEHLLPRKVSRQTASQREMMVEEDKHQRGKGQTQRVLIMCRFF